MTTHKKIGIANTSIAVICRTDQAVRLVFVFASFAVAAVVACAALCLPALPWTQHAYATYVDVRPPESAAVASDFATNGDALAVNQIPDGTYEISTVTTSRMCRFYSSKGGADTGGAPTQNPYSQKSVLTVSGGQGFATFYVTSAYSRLFYGTAEEAAAAAAAVDPEGLTDAPEFMISNPESDRVYTFPVSTLNQAYTFASYNGGRSAKDGAWMTRQVIFHVSDEILDAIDKASKPADPTPSTPADSGSQTSGQKTVDDPNQDAGDYNLPEAEAETKKDSDKKKKDKEKTKEKEKAEPLTGSGGGQGSGTGTGTGSGNKAGTQGNKDKKNKKDAKDAEKTSNASKADAGTKQGVLIYPSVMGIPDAGGGQGEQQQELKEQETTNQSPQAAMAGGVALVACAGVAWRCIVFAIARRKPPTL